MQAHLWRVLFGCRHLCRLSRFGNPWRWRAVHRPAGVAATVTPDDFWHDLAIADGNQVRRGTVLQSLRPRGTLDGKRDPERTQDREG